jgi:hypothetical protein
MKSGLVAALCALVMAPALISCLPVQRTDQTQTLREVKPMISSAVDEIQAMFPDASVRTSDSPTDGGYIFLSFDVRSSNTLEIHSMSDCYYLPDYSYKSEFQ